MGVAFFAIGFAVGLATGLAAFLGAAFLGAGLAAGLAATFLGAGFGAAFATGFFATGLAGAFATAFLGAGFAFFATGFLVAMAFLGFRNKYFNYVVIDLYISPTLYFRRKTDAVSQNFRANIGIKMIYSVF